MKYFLFLTIIFSLISCQRELTQEEKDKISQDSINQIWLAMGMNTDSSFSIIKYQKDLYTYEKENDLLDPFLHDFDDYTFIFNSNDEVFYYENPYKGYWLCGTASIELRKKKMIAELYEVEKQDLKKIDSDTLIHFIKKIDFKKTSNSDSYTSLVLAIEPEKLNSVSFLKLRKFLLENSYKYIIRPISTRERLVSNAFINDTSDDFSKVNWDSIYKVDYNRFHPELMEKE